MERDLGHVLIVGGTGMLAGASAWIAERASRVVLAARHPDRLAGRIGAEPFLLNWADHTAPLPAGPFDLALSWLHKDGLWLVPRLEALLRPGGRSVRVHPSSARDPAVLATRDGPPPARARRQVVILWRNADGSWLDHDQISDGVIQAIRTPERATLVVGDG